MKLYRVGTGASLFDESATSRQLPRDARPVTSWPNQDEAFADIARALREAARSS